MQLYSEILDAGGPAFGAILRHVRDSPNDGFIFHCTGALSALRDHLLFEISIQLGKTGLELLLLCFFLWVPRSTFIVRDSTISHQLAGASTDAISADYALTRIGRAPMRPVILSRLAREPLFASNPTAAHNLLSSRCVQSCPHVLANQLGREETMQSFLKMLGERYGGVKEYVRHACGLTDQDIIIIRQNLLTPKPY
jgi:hypothetical protein